MTKNSMKSFIAAMTILAAILASGFISMHKLETSAQTMLDKTQAITQALEAEDYTHALSLTDELSDYVENHSLLFATMTDHSSITGIEVYIGELRYYISGNVKYNALAKSAVLERLIRTLPENYLVRFENIL